MAEHQRYRLDARSLIEQHLAVCSSQSVRGELDFLTAWLVDMRQGQESIGAEGRNRRGSGPISGFLPKTR